MADHSHKSGAFKQQNKEHKAPHRSKGQLKREGGGKTDRADALRPSSKRKAEISRDARKNKARVQRSNQRRKDKQRVATAAPFLVGLVDLCGSSFQMFEIWKLLCEACGHQTDAPDMSTVTVLAPTSKRRITITPCARDIYSVLEVAKVVDCIVFVSDVHAAVDSFGELCVASLCAQGLPTSFHVVHGLSSVTPKQQSSVKKEYSKTLADLVNGRVCFVDTATDARDFIWPLLNQTGKPIKWRDVRAHMLVEATSFEPTSSESGTLLLSGYVRGRAWDPNELVYLQGYGAFQLESIVSAHDPCERRTSHRDAAMAQAEPAVLATPTVDIEPLDMEAAGVAEGEQTWPDEADFSHAQELERQQAAAGKAAGERRAVRVPRGWSDYQAAWIAESASEDGSDGSEDDSDGEDEDGMGGGVVGAGAGMSDDGSEPGDGVARVTFAESDNEDATTKSEAGGPQRASQYDATMNTAEDEAALAAFRAAAMDREFPDEVTWSVSIYICWGFLPPFFSLEPDILP